jgi:phospholipase C
MPGADPGEGYANTNAQLFGTGNPPSPPVATNVGFVTNYADAISYDQRSGRSVQAGTTASQIMGMFTPAGCRCSLASRPALRSATTGIAQCLP